jgi:hypothetical protein
MVEAIKSMSQGAERVIHEDVLLRQRVAELPAANEAATRRKSHKRKRIQKKGTLTVEGGLRLTTLKEVGARSDEKRRRRECALRRAARLQNAVDAAARLGTTRKHASKT